MGNQPQPVPAFLNSLSSEVKLHGAGDQPTSMLARVECICQVGFHLKFPLSSKLSALKTTYQFLNIICCLSNRSMYNSRKRQFSAVEHSLCDYFLFLFRSFFDDSWLIQLYQSRMLCQRACSDMRDYCRQSWIAGEISWLINEGPGWEDSPIHTVDKGRVPNLLIRYSFYMSRCRFFPCINCCTSWVKVESWRKMIQGIYKFDEHLLLHSVISVLDY